MLTLSGCKQNEPIQVYDYVIGSYEGPVGGPNAACSEVHTLYTNIPPAHYGLTECLRRMLGKVYMDGAALGQIQENIDLMCTELGSCTYQQHQAIALIKRAASQAVKVHSHSDRFR